MSDELDPVERHLARQLADFAETPFPPRDSLDQVVARAAADGHARATRRRIEALLAAAAAIAVAIAGVARLDILTPAATPMPTPTTAATAWAVGMLHLTADPMSDLPHDGLELRYLLADGLFAAESDAVPAETTVFVNRALRAGPLRILANGKECAGTITIQPGREIDAIFSGLYDAVCTISTTGEHAMHAVVHPEPYTGLGAFVVVDSVLVVRSLDAGNTTTPIRKPAGERAEVADFAVPPGRYELALEVGGVVLKTLQIDLKLGQAFYYNVRVLQPDVPVDCGEVSAAECRAAVEAAYAQPQGDGLPATRHVTAVRVRPSHYTGGCQPVEPPLFDVTFDIREEPGTVEVTLGARPDGRLYYCTY